MEKVKKNNNKLILLLKMLFFLVIFFIGNRAGVNELIYPFVFGFYFAFVWCNQNIILLSACYILAGYLATFSLYVLIGNILLCLIFLAIYWVHYKIKKPFKYLHILIYACICNIPKVAINICFEYGNVYLVFIELVFGLLFVFACIRFFEGVLLRGFGARLTLSEIICAGIVIVAIACGISTFNIYSFQFIKLFAIIGLLLISYMGNFSMVIIVAIAIGIGCVLGASDLILFLRFIIYAVVISMFKTKNKYYTIVALIATECLFVFYFKFDPASDICVFLPLLISSFIYLIFPTSILDVFSGKFETGMYGIACQNVINRNRELMFYRLSELSDVFAEMNRVYRGMISGGIDGGDAKRMLLNEVRIKNCKNCPSVGKCYHIGNGITLKSLRHMVDVGFEKGKINLLDVPTIFAGKCEKLGGLVASVNDMIDQYKNYAGLVNNIDASKVLLAEQLLGVSNIMKDLSMEINANVKFERGKEKRIIDELTYGNIICSDALVFETETEINVTISIRKSDVNNNSVEKIISKACGVPMEIQGETSSCRSGWQILTLKNAPKYDVLFGIATKTKTGSIISGDSYSIIKIKNGKYLFAICDGMGSGEKAEQTSSTAMGLLENFFKAGFDREIIISSVNKLLSLGKDDVFSALDLCVIDTNIGVGNFIKMGAPESFVKHKDTTKIIQIGALPLGIIQNVESRFEEIYFMSGDKIIMCSDGITDNFKSAEQMQDFINNLPNLTPQQLADYIIARVLSNNQNIARDDMTVIVAKIFEK